MPGLAFLKLNLNPMSSQLYSSKRKRSEGFSFGRRDINIIQKWLNIFARFFVVIMKVDPAMIYCLSHESC